MIVTARQGVEVRDHAGRGENTDPIDRRLPGRDQVQRRKLVLGDDAAKRRRAAGEFGKPVGGRFVRNPSDRSIAGRKPDQHDARIVRQRAREPDRGLAGIYSRHGAEYGEPLAGGAGVTQIVGDARDRAVGNAGRQRGGSRRLVHNRPRVAAPTPSDITASWSARTGTEPIGAARISLVTIMPELSISVANVAISTVGSFFG